ncbi:MAG: AEC family transporter [Fischerella sp.]|nr:AEC family transporter [Fischerella sp.]
MFDSLLQAYAPLFVCISSGMILFRFIPANFSTRLGTLLYWGGVPLQSFMFGRRTELGGQTLLIPLIVMEASLLSMGLALLSWWGWQKFNHYNAQELSKQQQISPQRSLDVGAGAIFQTALPKEHVTRSRFGSFILAVMLGNTGFIGMTLANALIDPLYLDWAIIYNVSGIITYSLAVFIASYFGQSKTQHPWWNSLRDVLAVPSQWAFFVGLLSQDVKLPLLVESALQAMIWVVFACALLLLGLHLGSIKGWSHLELALIPAMLKVLVIPAMVGLTATYLGLTGEPRLVLVMMTGVPTGVVTLILAEVYNLDRELLTACITLTLIGVLVILPVWLAWLN